MKKRGRWQITCLSLRCEASSSSGKSHPFPCEGGDILKAG